MPVNIISLVIQLVGENTDKPTSKHKKECTTSTGNQQGYKVKDKKLPTIRLLLYPLYICTDDFSLMITFVIDHSFIHSFIVWFFILMASKPVSNNKRRDWMIRKEPRVRPLPRHGTFVPGVSTQNVMRMEPAAMWNEAPQNASHRFYKNNFNQWQKCHGWLLIELISPLQALCFCR